MRDSYEVLCGAENSRRRSPEEDRGRQLKQITRCPLHKGRRCEPSRHTPMSEKDGSKRMPTESNVLVPTEASEESDQRGRGDDPQHRGQLCTVAVGEPKDNWHLGKVAHNIAGECSLALAGAEEVAAQELLKHVSDCCEADR